MSGKHAPSSGWSFYASLTRAVVVGAIALGLIVAIVMVTLGSDAGKSAKPPEPPVSTITPTSTGSVIPTDEPTVESPSPEPSPSETGPTGFKLSVSVLNGTDRSGLAARIRAKLVDEGYRRATSGNTGSVVSTKIYYRGDASRDAAEAIVKLIPELGEPIQAEADTPKGSVVIILGSDFQG